MASPKTILIIDDNRTIRNVIAKELSDGGYKTVEAEDGVHGLLKAVEFLPDLITLDVEMPKMDGYETCRRLYSDHYSRHFTHVENNKIPIIFVTARETIEDRRKGFDLGAIDFISKPFPKGTILKAVDGVLKPEGKLKGICALVAEDNLVNMTILSRFLEGVGVEVIKAEDGKAAYDLLAEMTDEVDLVITDYSMPKMNGGELCEKIRTELGRKDMPVILLTASAEKSKMLELFKQGITDYITKPFVKEELLARLIAHLERTMMQKNLEYLVEERTAELEAANESLKEEMQIRARLEEERLEIQRKVVIQDKMATLGQVATGVAHELNQPLTYITTILQTTIERLQKNEFDTEKLIKKFKKAVHQADRILGITTHLRTVGRTDDAKRQQVNLAEVIDDSLILMNEKMKLRNISLELDIPDDLPSIHGVHNKLEQVFINLTSNAIDALEMEGGGDIKIEMRKDIDKVVVCFADNGSGMPPEVRDKIFEPFYTTKERGKGTGLGMAIINDIIVDHGGDIICESEQGVGTTFFITLPIQQVADTKL